ncbi:MAG TPA: aldehyde dehydrogenase family protein [Schlesneria sp.]|jgi:acyl-CoA reductase-like NAD-dependent aldehyde dehydrogenase
MSPVIQVVQAFDRQVFAEIPVNTREDLESKLTQAQQAFGRREAWLKPHERIQILQRASSILDSRRAEFATLIAREGGKPVSDATIEVVRAVDGLRNAAEEMRNFAGREIPMGLTPASDCRWAFTTKEPIGVVGAISAFNHPLNLIVHQIAPAIAVGCPVIVKPAPATPLCCIELVKILRECGLPESWCQTFITDDVTLAEEFATDPRIAFLSFVGSARVGWHLRSRLPPGTRYSLEHGGAAPVIIDRSANLANVIEPIAKGGYYHAGQVCVSVQRIFIHTDILQEFLDQFSSRVTRLRVGDPLLVDTEVGPLIHPHECTRVADWTEEAVSRGAKLIGGEWVSETTLRPAILVDPPNDVRVSLQEVFGPVTCVYGFNDLERAIDIANSLPFAFQASVFSTELVPALRAARRLDASTVLLNDHTAFRTDWMPFGGRRQSGYGVGGIPSSMKEMSHEKMIVVRHED